MKRFNQPPSTKPFNQSRHHVFYISVGFIEIGERGTINIINECLEYGLPATNFLSMREVVRTTFCKRAENEIVDGNINLWYKWRYKWQV